MTILRYKDQGSTLSRRERKVLAAILGLVGLFTVLDVAEDYLDGAPVAHIIPEVLMIFLTVGVALYLLRNLLISRKHYIDSVEAEVEKAKEVASSWQSKADQLSKGISDAISEQFQEWGLSNAEQEVSFLLLKGLSIQEISEVRDTSERTVRQQASEVYRKSGLSGRAQLSAFFLEDLFDRQ